MTIDIETSVPDAVQYYMGGMESRLTSWLSALGLLLLNFLLLKCLTCVPISTNRVFVDRKGGPHALNFPLAPPLNAILS